MKNDLPASGPPQRPLADATRQDAPVRHLIMLVDLLGVLGVIGTVGGVFYTGSILSEGASELVQSLSADLLAVWLSVRLLERIIRGRDRGEAIRTRVLRNARYWRGALGRMLGRVDLLELDTLWHETEYTRQLISESSSRLNAREIEIYRQVLDNIEESLARCEVIGWSSSRVEALVHQFEADNLVFIRQARTEERSTGVGDVMRAAELRQIVTMTAQLCGNVIQDFNSCRAEIDTARRAVDALNGPNPIFEPDRLNQFFTTVNESVDSKQQLAEKYVQLRRLVSDLGADMRHDIPER